MFRPRKKVGVPAQHLYSNFGKAIATKLLRQFSTFLADNHVLFKHDLKRHGTGPDVNMS